MSLRSMLQTGLILASLTGLGACSSVDSLTKLQPGVSTEADANALSRRKPDYVWSNADGTRTLEYSNQPLEGLSTWMITVGADGKVIGKEQMTVVSTDEDVRRGMTQDEVRRLLGTPRSVVNYKLSGEEVWDWNASDATPGYPLRYNVHFKAGRVVRTSTTVVTPNY